MSGTYARMCNWKSQDKYQECFKHCEWGREDFVLAQWTKKQLATHNVLMMLDPVVDVQEVLPPAGVAWLQQKLCPLLPGWTRAQTRPQKV
jgi:hypothetical protein